MAAKTKSSTLADQVRERLGENRISALALQPLALAAGGMDSILQQACTECAGFPDPVTAAATRSLQLCGSSGRTLDATPTTQKD
jgi:hypothetical protein